MEGGGGEDGVRITMGWMDGVMAACRAGQGREVCILDFGERWRWMRGHCITTGGCFKSQYLFDMIMLRRPIYEL